MSDKEIYKYIEQGNEYSIKGNHEEAIKYYQKVLNLDKNNVRAFFDMAVSLGYLSKYEKAIEYFDKVLKREKNNIDVYLRKGFCLTGLEKYKEAIECYNEIIKVDSKNFNAFYGIATSLNAQEKYASAIEYYDKAILYNQNNSFFYKSKADVLSKLGKTEEAEKLYDLAKEKECPNEPTVLVFYVQALSGRVFSMKIETQNQKIIFDFLGIFSNVDYKTHTIEFVATQQMRQELRDKIDNFVEVYKSAHKEVHQLKKSFDDIPDNDWFTIVPSVEEITTEQFLKINLYLMEQAGEDIDKYKDMFSIEINSYKMEVMSPEYEQKKIYGEKDKKKRICKYCGKSSPDEDFSHRAHIIPESLGNKVFFDAEECDGCNKYFGDSIEPDLNNYLAPFKTIYGVKGKKKIPKIKGEGVRLIHHTNGSLEIGSTNIEFDDKRNPKKITLPMKATNRQNIYRSFVKIALGFIPQNEVKKNFAETVDWIRKPITITKLPPIISFFNKHNDAEIPLLMVLYTRKEEASKDLPYLVAEFYFYQFTFNYVIPFSKQDKIDFSDENNFNQFHEQWHSSKVEYSLLYCNNNERTEWDFVMTMNKEN